MPQETPNPTVQALNRLARYVYDVFDKQPGTIIAQGTNTTPVPHGGLSVSLISYKVERLTLPSPVTWNVMVPSHLARTLEERTVTFDKAWRLTVTGGRFWVADDFWYVWIDNTLVGRGINGNDGLMAILFDPTLLREGGAIGVSYGNGGPGPGGYLPERLHLTGPP